MADEDGEKLDRIVSELLNVKELVSTETAAVRDEIRDLRDTSINQFDHLTTTLGRLDSEYHALAAGVRRIEIEIGSTQPEAVRVAIRSQLAELKKLIVDLEKRVEALERAS